MWPSSPFGIEGGIWDVIVLISDHCLFYLLNLAPLKQIVYFQMSSVIPSDIEIILIELIKVFNI